MGAGLLLVLAAQITGDWLYFAFAGLFQSQGLSPSPVAVTTWGRGLALALVASGIYAYLYSDLVVRRKGLYVYLAAF
jgi:hypothetical protein